MLQAVLIAGSLIVGAQPQPSCSLTSSSSSRLEGTCLKLIEGTDARIDIGHASTIVSGQWRRDRKPTSVWSGTLATSDYPRTAVELEVYRGGRGMMRTVFGWYPVSDFSQSARGVQFNVDPDTEVPPSSVDLDIIRRASQILSNVSAWNRSDNRQCPADARTWSIYCAMERATVETAGAFHHRRPALEVVRQIVDERTRDRPYEHRLMDYNNDPTTQLADVQSLFSEALKRSRSAIQPQH